MADPVKERLEKRIETLKRFYGVREVKPSRKTPVEKIEKRTKKLEGR